MFLLKFSKELISFLDKFQYFVNFFLLITRTTINKPWNNEDNSQFCFSLWCPHWLRALFALTTLTKYYWNKSIKILYQQSKYLFHEFDKKKTSEKLKIKIYRVLDETISIELIWKQYICLNLNASKIERGKKNSMTCLVNNFQMWTYHI